MSSPLPLCSGDSYLTRGFYSKHDADLLYDQLRTELDYVPRASMTFSIYGKTFELPRDKAFQGDVNPEDGSYPLYRYGGKSYPVVQAWTPTVKLIRDRVQEEVGGTIKITHVVCNRYRDGHDHIGMHADKLARDGSVGGSVFTVSFGATRRFDLQKQSRSKQRISMDLEHGSLFELGWKTNRRWKHSIVKLAKRSAVGERISLTFRCIKTVANADGTVRA